MLILVPFQHIDRIESLVCLLLAFSFGTTFGSLIQFPCFICLFYIPIYSSFSSYFSFWFLFALFLRPALIIQPMLAFPHVLPPLIFCVLGLQECSTHMLSLSLISCVLGLQLCITMATFCFFLILSH